MTVNVDEPVGFSVEIEDEWCCASGACVVEAPGVFDQGSDGIVVLLTDRPPTALLRDVERAARTCPSKVIAVKLDK